MSLIHSPKVVTDGLVFCVDAGNTKSYPGSGATWVDLVGNNPLTNTGVTYSSGAMVYPGAASSRSFGAGTSNLDSQTISMEIWVSASTFEQNSVFFEKGTLNSQYSLIFWGGGYLYWRVVTAAGALMDLNPQRSGYVIDNRWNHIVGTFAPYGLGYEQKLYANGVLMASRTPASVDPVATGKVGLSIGTDGYGSWQFAGKVAAARIYNRVLTADEVQQNFNAGRGRFGV